MSNQAVTTTKNPFSNAVTAAAPGGALTSSAASAETQRAIAEVQAAILLAKQFPRDRVAAYERIMNECCREGLAEVAVYEYARGGTQITGPSIRLAEALAREWGNIQAGWKEVSRHNGVSEIEAWAWDVETNVRYPISFHVRHWRDTKKGGYQLTDERDIYELCANQASRRLRACILRALPGDVVEAAVKQCETTLATKVQVTPERIKNMVAEFGKFGVTKEQLEKRVQRRIDTITGAQMMTLIKIYNSLRDGMSNAGDWFEVAEAEAPKKGNEGAKEALKSKDAPTSTKTTEEDSSGTAMGDSTTSPQQHDPATGEIIEEANTTPAEFDIADHDLTSQKGVKAASKALVDYLRAVDAEYREDVFREKGGQDVVDALSKNGLGMEKKHYTALGITV